MVFATTMPVGENPGLGRPEKNWAQCLADDLNVFQTSARSTESCPLMFGEDSVLWTRTAKKSEKWYRGVVEAADYSMAMWHRVEAERSWLRHAALDARSSDQSRGGGGQSYVLIRLSRVQKRNDRLGSKVRSDHALILLLF